MNCKCVYVLLATLLAAGCQLPKAGSGDLSGCVTELATGNPMEGVSVIYGDSAVFTTSSGNYIYKDIPDGLQGVRFVMSGYYTVMRQVNITNGAEASCDVSMELVRTGWAAGLNDSGYGAILHTSDGGVSWVRQGSQAQVPDVRLTDVCAVDDMTCWIAGEADTSMFRTVLLKTVDGGATWSNQGSSVSGLPPVSIASVVAQDSDTAWAVCADTCIVLKTTNGGRQWSICRESGAVSSYAGITLIGREIWACGTGVTGGSVVEYSPDGGFSWSEYSVAPAYDLQHPLAICAAPGGTVYLTVGNSLGVVRSGDGGRTWEAVQSSLSDLHALDAFGESRVWAAGGGNVLYLSENAFASSVEIFPATGTYTDGTVTSVSFLRDGSTGVVSVVSATGETGSVYYTADGGYTWSSSSIPFAFAIESVDFVGGFN